MRGLRNWAAEAAAGTAAATLRTGWQATPQCAARLPDAENEVTDTHGEAISAGRALAAEQARPAKLGDDVARSECAVARLRRRLASLERREREVGAP